MKNSLVQSETTITTIHETTIPLDQFRELSQELEQAKSSLEQQKKKQEDQQQIIREYERQKAAHEAVESELRHTISLLETQQEHDHEAHSDELDAVKQELSRVMQDCERVNSELKSAKTELFLKADDLQKAEDLIARMKGEMSSSEAEANDLNTKLRKKDEEIEKMRIEKVLTQQQMDSLESQLTVASADNVRFNSVISELKEQASRKDSELAHLKRQLDESDRKLSDVTQQMNTKKEKFDKLVKANEELNQAIEILQKQKESQASMLENMELQVDVAKKSIDQEKNQAQLLSADLTKYKAKAKAIQQENTRLKAQLDASKKSELELQRKLERVQREKSENDQKGLTMEKKITLLRNQSSTMVSTLRSIHSYLSVYGAKVSDPMSLLKDLVQKMQALFDEMSLPSVKLSRAKKTLKRKYYETINVAPNPDEAKFIPPAHAHLISSMRQELMSFPIQGESTTIEPTARMTAQLEQLRSLVLLVKRLFQEREAHIEEMAKLISSQHSAVMRLSKNKADKDVVELSQHNNQIAQDLISKDRMSRQQFQVFSGTSKRKL